MKNLSFNEIGTLTSLTLVEFWSTSCHACVLAEPFLLTLEEAYKGRCAIAKLNVFEEAQVIDIYNIKILPTFLLFNDMGCIDKVEGFKKDFIEKAIRSHL
jgi:thioredoxin-like negative regulator of GroEL